MKEQLIDTVAMKIENTPVEIVLDDTFLFWKRGGAFSERTEKSIHFHSQYEIFFVGQEETVLVTEQGERRYRNSVIIVPPRCKHYARRREGTYRLFVGINGKGQGGAFNATLGRLAKKGKPIAFSQSEETAFYLERLNEELAKGRCGEKGRALLALILLSLHERLQPAETKKGEKKRFSENEYLFKIDMLMETSLSQKVTLSTAARELFVCEKQAARIIKKHFGCTLSELIKEKKLSAAALLLQNTEKTIAQIAEELNFQTQSYFFVLFKKKYGCTPLAYREKFLS